MIFHFNHKWLESDIVPLNRIHRAKPNGRYLSYVFTQSEFERNSRHRKRRPQEPIRNYNKTRFLTKIIKINTPYDVRDNDRTSTFEPEEITRSPEIFAGTTKTDEDSSEDFRITDPTEVKFRADEHTTSAPQASLFVVAEEFTANSI